MTLIRHKHDGLVTKIDYAHINRYCVLAYDRQIVDCRFMPIVHNHIFFLHSLSTCLTK